MCFGRVVVLSVERSIRSIITFYWAFSIAYKTHRFCINCGFYYTYFCVYVCGVEKGEIFFFYGGNAIQVNLSTFGSEGNFEFMALLRMLILL